MTDETRGRGKGGRGRERLRGRGMQRGEGRERGGKGREREDEGKGSEVEGGGSVYLTFRRYQEKVPFPRLEGLYQDFTHNHGTCSYQAGLQTQ